MTEWSTALLKKRFSKFFEERQHEVLPSSSVIPKNDPTFAFFQQRNGSIQKYIYGRGNKTYTCFHISKLY